MNEENEKGLDLAMRGGNFSPVSITNHDTIGVAFLGVLAVVLLAAFLRVQRRLSEVEKQLIQARGQNME